MFNTQRFTLDYTLPHQGAVSESVKFFQQKIVDALGNTVKYELLSHVPSMALDLLMGEITSQEKYTFDMNILNEVLSFITYDSTKNKYSINLNPSTLIHPDFIKDITQLFYKYRIVQFGQIDFEITENGYFDDEQMRILNKNIAYLRNIGIQVGIDDYPNMNNNNKLLERIESIDFVKIDKGFLLSYKENLITLDMLLRSLHRQIQDIHARVGNVQIVIEGVENEELFSLLKQHFSEQITLFQGYHFSS